MTTTASHPSQVRLPGQVAAPDGPIDMYPMYLMHHAFRRDLDRFVAAVSGTPLRDRTTWRRLVRRWQVFATALHDHHTSEDRHIWPYVTVRADDSERRVLAAMEAEHRDIDPLLESCREGLTLMVDEPSERRRTALHADLVAARDGLGRHLGHEEAEAIPVIQRRVSAEEWRRLEKDRLQKDARLRDALAVVPWAMHGVPDDVRERVFAAPGGSAFRVMWAVTRGRFERRERRAFRYA
jgi:hemerythrin-like domain-containing protein